MTGCSVDTSRPRAPLRRDPDSAGQRDYDVIIVGGGIQGCTLALEAAKRGLSALLLERDDFGSGASWASLRILHGGLRDLQRLDFRHARLAAAEQAWFRTSFPTLVEPLPFLLPLYGGLRRPSILRVALATHRRIKGSVAAAAEMNQGSTRVLSVHETVTAFPWLCKDGLLGAALWHELRMVSSERIIIEILRWAAALGGEALNYMEAEELTTRQGRVSGVMARCRLTGTRQAFRGTKVLEATGPGTARLTGEASSRLAPDLPAVLAFNLLLRQEPRITMAFGTRPSEDDGRSYFLVPWRNNLLAGTFHVDASQTQRRSPSRADIENALGVLAKLLPDLTLDPSDVLEVYAGLLPARAEGSLVPSNQESVFDAEAHGGPAGYIRVCGTKFTLARALSEKVIERMTSAREGSPAAARGLSTKRFDPVAPEQVVPSKVDLSEAVRDESVAFISDVVLRRLDAPGTISDREVLALRVGAQLSPVQGCRP